MKKSELLKKAKEHLCDGSDLSNTTEFVCCSISRAASQCLGDYWNTQACQLRDWIEDDLMEGKFDSYNGWLKENRPDIDQEDYKLIQSLRHQWLDWMIEYWRTQEAKENK